MNKLKLLTLSFSGIMLALTGQAHPNEKAPEEIVIIEPAVDVAGQEMIQAILNNTGITHELMFWLRRSSEDASPATRAFMRELIRQLEDPNNFTTSNFILPYVKNGELANHLDRWKMALDIN